jgi:hypothetical protein
MERHAGDGPARRWFILSTGFAEFRRWTAPLRLERWTSHLLATQDLRWTALDRAFETKPGPPPLPMERRESHNT